MNCSIDESRPKAMAAASDHRGPRKAWSWSRPLALKARDPRVKALARLPDRDF